MSVSKQQAVDCIKSLFKNVRWKDPIFHKDGFCAMFGDTITTHATTMWRITFKIGVHEDWLEYCKFDVLQKFRGLQEYANCRVGDNIYLDGRNREQVLEFLRKLSLELQTAILNDLERLKRGCSLNPPFEEESLLYY